MRTSRIPLLPFLLATTLLLLGARAQEPRVAPAQAVAVIVDPRNPITDVAFDDLRAYCRLDRQFWPDKTKTALFLRPSSSTEGRVLLQRVYRMTHAELQRFWVAKIFRNEIAAKPPVVPTAHAAGARVREVEGAFSFVLASEVPEGVRVITVDGKQPSDPGYALTVDPDA